MDRNRDDDVGIDRPRPVSALRDECLRAAESPGDRRLSDATLGHDVAEMLGEGAGPRGRRVLAHGHTLSDIRRSGPSGLRYA